MATTVGQDGQTLRGVGRAFAGALLFSLPVLLTREMWTLGVTVDRYRMVIVVLATVALTTGLARYFGVVRHPQLGWRDTAVNAGVALVVGFVTAAGLLWILSVVDPLRQWREAVSVVSIETLPAAIGAAFARSQLGVAQRPGRPKPSYLQEVFLMAAGAVVLSASIAPTQEIMMLAARTSELDIMLLVVVELVVMHAFVYHLDFKGGSPAGELRRAFTAFTLVGFLVAFAISAYLLWTFGRFDATALAPAVAQTVLLTLPASVGAAAARLIV